MFPQLLTEVFQKALARRLPNQSLKSFFFSGHVPKMARNKSFSVLFKSKVCEYCTQCSSSFTLFLFI